MPTEPQSVAPTSSLATLAAAVDASAGSAPLATSMANSTPPPSLVAPSLPSLVHAANPIGAPPHSSSHPHVQAFFAQPSQQPQSVQQQQQQQEAQQQRAMLGDWRTPQSVSPWPAQAQEQASVLYPGYAMSVPSSPATTVPYTAAAASAAVAPPAGHPYSPQYYTWPGHSGSFYHNMAAGGAAAAADAVRDNAAETADYSGATSMVYGRQDPGLYHYYQMLGGLPEGGTGGTRDPAMAMRALIMSRAEGQPLSATPSVSSSFGGEEVAHASFRHRETGLKRARPSNVEGPETPTGGVGPRPMYTRSYTAGLEGAHRASHPGEVWAEGAGSDDTQGHGGSPTTGSLEAGLTSEKHMQQHALSLMHMPNALSKARKCVWCSAHGQRKDTQTMCTACGKAFCNNHNRNCFVEYHCRFTRGSFHPEDWQTVPFSSLLPHPTAFITRKRTKRPTAPHPSQHDRHDSGAATVPGTPVSGGISIKQQSASNSSGNGGGGGGGVTASTSASPSESTQRGYEPPSVTWGSTTAV